MLLGFKTELKLNNAQRTHLAKSAGVARHCYNQGLALTKAVLDHNRDNPEDKIKFPSKFDLNKWMAASLKVQFPWYYEVSKCVPLYAIEGLRYAWDRFFRGVSKPPRFKKKGRSQDSFTIQNTKRYQHIEPFKVKLPKIGWLKTYEQIPTGFNPGSFTISRKADKWFVSFNIETEEMDFIKPFDTVGVDLGIKTLATLSDGKTFKVSRKIKELQNKISRIQWLSRNKVIGSSNWKKAMLKISKIHMRIVNIRKDTLHKLTTYLTKNHSKVVIETLNVSGMLKNHKLAKAVQNMGFFEFARQLEYKAKLYGSEIVKASKWFPSSKTCSCCGVVKENLSLSERIFNCLECGFSLDRDLNAAINLANQG